jgi:hypothetical protein
MALTNSYVQVYGQLSDLFSRIREAGAPDKFTTQHLKDWGYTSSNFRAVIPLLKSLGFLAPDGSPTTRYHDYRNNAQSASVMAEALRDAYGDLFNIKANPTQNDRNLIEGKFKSSHNVSPNIAKIMASTFYSLLGLADLSSSTNQNNSPLESARTQPADPQPAQLSEHQHKSARPSLHYNIQIHLPATKDIEVFNAIFKSLKEHLLD